MQLHKHNDCIIIEYKSNLFGGIIFLIKELYSKVIETLS